MGTLNPLRSAPARRALASALRHVRPLRIALRLATRLIVPRQRVGALAVVLDGRGRLLLAEHVFRSQYPWGLPGGWLQAGEPPERALAREVREETGLEVQVLRPLLCAQHGPDSGDETASGLSLVYECRLTGTPEQRARSWELLDVEWVEPKEALLRLRRFEQEAVRLVLDVGGAAAAGGAAR